MLVDACGRLYSLSWLVFKVSIRNQKLHPCHCATDVPILHIRVTILTTESTDDECTSSALTMHHFECDDIGQHRNIFKF
ncbi:hypothetical protein ACLKA7_009191 [Drosophila subpalustris]